MQGSHAWQKICVPAQRRLRSSVSTAQPLPCCSQASFMSKNKHSKGAPEVHGVCLRRFQVPRARERRFASFLRHSHHVSRIFGYYAFPSVPVDVADERVVAVEPVRLLGTGSVQRHGSGMTKHRSRFYEVLELRMILHDAAFGLLQAPVSYTHLTLPTKA